VVASNTTPSSVVIVSRAVATPSEVTRSCTKTRMTVARGPDWSTQTSSTHAWTSNLVAVAGTASSMSNVTPVMAPLSVQLRTSAQPVSSVKVSTAVAVQAVNLPEAVNLTGDWTRPGESPFHGCGRRDALCRRNDLAFRVSAVHGFDEAGNEGAQFGLDSGDDPRLEDGGPEVLGCCGGSSWDGERRRGIGGHIVRDRWMHRQAGHVDAEGEVSGGLPMCSGRKDPADGEWLGPVRPA